MTRYEQDYQVGIDSAKEHLFQGGKPKFLGVEDGTEGYTHGWNNTMKEVTENLEDE